MITPEDGRRAKPPPAQDFASYLAEASEVLSASLDYQATMNSLAHFMVPSFADWCAVDVVEKDGIVRRLAVVHEDPEKVAWARKLQRRYPPDPEALHGVPSVLRTGKSEWCREVTDEMLVTVARDSEHLRIMREVGFTSVMILPLVAREQTLGAITLVLAESGRRYEDVDLMLGEDLARRAALALDNARLYGEVQRKLAERQELEEDRARLAAIVESSDDVIIGKTLEGVITSWNQGAQRIYGYSPEETLGKPISMLVPPDRHYEIPTVLERIRQGEKVDHFETIRITKDGRKLNISLTVSPIRNSAGDIVGASTIARDITERKRDEEELRKRDAISEAVRFAAECFLRQSGTWEQNAQEVLEMLGHATGVSRVYIFENYIGKNGETWATKTYEWVAPGVSLQIDNLLLKARPYKAAGFGRWMETLEQGQTLCGHARDLSEGEWPEPEADGPLSYVLVPIFVENEWWGFVGFDECVAERDFSMVELDALESAADTLGAAVRRDRDEQALRREHDFNSAVLDTAGALVIVFDREGRIVRFNRTCEILTGYSSTEVHGRHYLELFLLQEEIDQVREVMDEVLAGRFPSAHENRWVTRDGSTRLISWNTTALVDEQGEPEYFIGTGIDITQRQQAEKQLREKEEQYRKIFNATGDGLVITDLDGHFVDANPAFCRMHGYDSSEELVDSHAMAWVHPDYRQLREEYASTIETGSPFQVQAVDVRKDGTTFPVEVHGSAFTYRGEPDILGVVRDITERVESYRLLEKRVQERTRELSTLLKVSNDVASTLELEPLLDLILDQLRSVVDYTDSSLLVYEGTDLVTVGYRGPVPQDQIMGTRFPPGRGRTMLEEGGPMEPIIIHDVRSDAPLAWAYRQVVGKERLNREFSHIRSWLGVPLVSKGQPIGLLAIIHDKPGHYTERHAELARTIANQAATAIENARLYKWAQSTAALEERQRLARELHDSVSQALYGITLGSDAALTLLERDPSRLAEPLEYVRSLAEAGLSEMRALIFELRPESLESEGLIAALEKQVAALRARYEIDVHITIACAEPDVSLEAKETLYRIAQEALHNTVKHARASRADLKLDCEVSEVILEVGDDGAGFDPEGAFPGHLGLKSMRERAECLGGTLEVESTVGRGTRILARIPFG